jgi:hypothetical protein
LFRKTLQTGARLIVGHAGQPFRGVGGELHPAGGIARRERTKALQKPFLTER